MADTAGSRFERLLDIMRTLREPGGCPWDREQTHASLRPFVLEETYELLEAIESGSAADLKELNALGPAERAARERELRWERKIPTPEDRQAKLLELRDREAAALANYSWIDKDNGVVRLPIERAMELTIQEVGQGKAGGAR